MGKETVFCARDLRSLGKSSLLITLSRRRVFSGELFQPLILGAAEEEEEEEEEEELQGKNNPRSRASALHAFPRTRLPFHVKNPKPHGNGLRIAL